MMDLKNKVEKQRINQSIIFEICAEVILLKSGLRPNSTLKIPQEERTAQTL